MIVTKEVFDNVVVLLRRDIELYARGKLSNNRTLSQDVAQSAIEKVLGTSETFLGRDLDNSDDLVREIRAFMFTITRNVIIDNYKKGVRHGSKNDPVVHIPFDEAEFTNRLSHDPEQQSHVDLQDVLRIMQNLPENQRNAVMLSAMMDYGEPKTYVESIGMNYQTFKSNVKKGRAALMEMCDYPPAKGK